MAYLLRKDPGGSGIASDSRPGRLRRRAARCALTLAVSFHLAGPAAADEPAVPWFDLVAGCEYLVVAEVASLHRPGPRLERGALRVEQVLIGRPPTYLALRLPGPLDAPAARSPLASLQARGAPLGGSLGQADRIELWRPGTRMLVFVSRHPDLRRRYAPVRGAHGVFPLSPSGEDAARRLAAGLLAAGDELRLATLLPSLQRAGGAPTPSLLATALAELDRRVGPNDAGSLAELLCGPDAYWPAVQRNAARWASRLGLAAARPCREPGLRDVAADAIEEMGTPFPR